MNNFLNVISVVNTSVDDFSKQLKKYTIWSCKIALIQQTTARTSTMTTVIWRRNINLIYNNRWKYYSHLFVQSLIADMHQLRRHVVQIFLNNLRVYLSNPCYSHQDRMHSDCPTCENDSHDGVLYPLSVAPTFHAPRCVGPVNEIDVSK